MRVGLGLELGLGLARQGVVTDEEAKEDEVGNDAIQHEALPHLQP